MGKVMMVIEFAAVIVGLVALGISWAFFQARRAKEVVFEYTKDLAAIKLASEKTEEVIELCKYKALEKVVEPLTARQHERQMKKDKDTVNAARVNVQ